MFKNIDYNSCLHEEYLPYKVEGQYLTYPPRFRRMYFEKIFDHYDLDSERIGKISLEKLKSIDVTVDDLREIQRGVFYLDQWYNLLDDVTFPSFFIDIKPSHRVAIRDRDMGNLRDLENEIKKYMKKHKDWVWFAKLNSVSPKDGTKSGKELKFTDSDDIIRRFMDCNRTRVFICEDPTSSIVLRKWYDIPENMEFRCFIREKKLRAISQYHCEDFFPELVAQKEDLLYKIKTFYTELSNRIPYEDAVMDVAILDEKVLIIEFNQFGAETSCGSCLYNWDLDYQILYHN